MPAQKSSPQLHTRAAELSELGGGGRGMAPPDLGRLWPLLQYLPPTGFTDLPTALGRKGKPRNFQSSGGYGLDRPYLESYYLDRTEAIILCIVKESLQ